MELRHRLPGVFMKIPPLWLPGKKGNKKALIPKLTLGTRTENKIFCGTTLFAVCENDRSVRCQHTACHITPALRQRILRIALSPCPRRPICRSAFRPALSSAGLPVDALSALLPLLRFALLNLESLYIRNVRLSRTFFHEGENNFNTPVQRLSQGPESERGFRQWGNSSRFRA